MQVGEIRVGAAIDGYLFVAAEQALQRPGTEDAWAGHRDLLNDQGQLELPVGSFVVRTGDRLILVDAGLGPMQDIGHSSGDLMENLARFGVEAPDVTDVLLTHLHSDHIGWVTQHGAVVFPNATYRCHASDWERFVTSPQAEEHCACPSCRGVETCDYTLNKLTPLADRVELFSGDQTVAPGIDVRDAPGHTPGSSIVILSSGRERAMLLGDVAHCPIELTDLEWEAIHDVDPVTARRTRESLARELDGSDIPVAAAHFPGMRFGRLLPGQGASQWVYD